jgi:hypothetical protein
LSALRFTIVAAAVLAWLVIAGCQTAPHTSTQWNTYGEVVKFDETSQVALGSLKGHEKNVWVNGIITEVCSHQGCWIKLKDPKNPAAEDLFIRTRDHAFLVPRNSHGHAARIYGDAEISELSVDDLRHYAEEAGKSEAQIAAITQPRRTVTFWADTIVIAGPGLDKPADQE